MQNAKRRKKRGFHRNAKCKMQNAKCKMKDKREDFTEMQSAKCKMQNAK
jgi:hypothetical protein